MNRPVTMLGAGALALFALVLAPASASAADTYNVDAGHSSVVFMAKHLGASWTAGIIPGVTGKVAYEAKDVRKSSVAIEIDLNRVFTGDKKRDGHLKSPDFFDVKQYSKATFQSTKVAESGGKLSVTGDLTLRGVTKSVTITMAKVGEGKDPWGGYRIGWTGELTIKRADYGISYMPSGLGDDVRLWLNIEGIKKQ